MDSKLITLSMIVKNEEKFLTGCLESVKGVVDEIVIVDTGSTDNTKKIAAEFGAKVFDFNWVNDFSAARNFSLQNSTGNWILYLDADERLHQNSKQRIKKLAGGSRKKAYSCIVNSIDNVKNRPSKMDYIRFFPRHPGVKFEGAAHEQIIPSLIKTSHQIIRTEIEIIHLGYNISADELKLKAGRNLSLLLNDYKIKKHSYSAFQIAQSYSLMSDEENAVKYFKIALDDAKLLSAYKAVAFRYLAAYESQKMKWNEAFDLAQKSLLADAMQPLTYLVLSQIYQGVKDFNNAELNCRKALDINAKIANRSLASDMVIMIDEKSILYRGLNLCLMNGEREPFNFYFSKLKGCGNGDSDELALFNLLINNIKYDDKKLSNYMVAIKSETQVELVLSLLKTYTHNKQPLLEEMLKHTGDNVLVINALAAEYENKKEYNRAEEFFKKSISINSDFPPSYFFLLSLYLKQSNTNSALKVVADLENRFGGNSVIAPQVQAIKEKIVKYFNS
ncbi:MAG: glycosyltransferase [Ignavibacteriaceae bacterium]|nr:glycosyltransferase [Ignavibacteriaceae bacterium]